VRGAIDNRSATSIAGQPIAEEAFLQVVRARSQAFSMTTSKVGDAGQHRPADEKKPRRSGVFYNRAGLRALDVGSLLAFRALRDFELNFLTFFEGLKTVHVDCGEVCEQILAAVIWSDEAKAFGIIEPLNSTCCHKELSNIIFESHEP
jgi:hypothetical protein